MGVPSYIDFGKWLKGSGSIVKAQIPLRAQVQQFRIEDKEFDLILLRKGIPLPPQTVRVELEDSSSMGDDDSGIAFSANATVFGIHGHPELPDTDIKVWDTFTLHDMQFTVKVVNRLVHGQVQAYCEAV